MSRKPRITSRSATKRGERERSAGLEEEDAAAQWLAANDPKLPPERPQRAFKSKAVHRFRQRQQRD